MNHFKEGSILEVCIVLPLRPEVLILEALRHARGYQTYGITLQRTATQSNDLTRPIELVILICSTYN